MKKSVYVLGITLSLALVLTACSGKQEQPVAQTNDSPTPVQVDKVVSGSINQQAGITGKLSPDEEVALAPKVSGKIVSLNVKLGQYVKQGQVLFSLDKTDLNNAVRSAQASYQVAVASLRQSDTSSNSGLVSAQNGLQQAVQALADAQKNEQRMTELFNQGAISAQQLEQAKAGLVNAQTAYNNAKQSLDSAQKKAPIAVSEASVAQAQVAVTNAQQQLANATVVSPISGFVSQVRGSVGEMAGPQAAVVTIVDTDPLIVKANLSEQEVTGIKVGDKVNVELSALKKELQGTVSAVSPVMDAALRAYPIEISLANSDNQLKADMVVDVKLINGQAKKSLIIPRKAVFDENSKRFVYKLDGEAAKKVEVVTGEESSDQIEIKEGLTEGDTVVVRGQTLLKDGAKVQIQKAGD